MSSDANTNTSGFTANESKLLMSIMKNLEGELKADFDAVAEEMGYKDSGVAKARWNQIKRKKIMVVGGGGSVEKSGSGKKVAGVKRAALAGGDEEEGTPKRRGRKAKVVKSEEVVEEDGDGEEEKGNVKATDEDGEKEAVEESIES
ncbi:Hypothetical protein R9X50_00373200 [Acrodontium crateriforme]|uniref:Myb-like DNA-binding domain-containing protein n=1 Tax=Acrodontium crateriforme TaxID=150365 RepID=A0AAQ3RC42_9PEZI|nr:Hypothetical protein R9X50_00373200 [Acrodontium crateriforme]